MKAGNNWSKFGVEVMSTFGWARYIVAQIDRLELISDPASKGSVFAEKFEVRIRGHDCLKALNDLALRISELNPTEGIEVQPKQNQGIDKIKA